MIIFLTAVTVLYALLIGAIIFGWSKLPEERFSEKAAEITFSIIIPFRNEAENLPELLISLKKLNYPKNLFEILLVNDASEDNSPGICSHFKQDNPELDLKLLENQRTSKSPKKDAITTAINNSKYEFILTTDADCTLPENWLRVFNQKLLETGADLLAGPVALKLPSKTSPGRYFFNFQEMDFLSLQVSGAGGFGLEKAFMCSGANLCYQKSSFIQVGGFDGNDNISSGDDVFLLQKFVQHNFYVEYLKSREAIVLTQPQPNLGSLISQRIRWAAKTPSYNSSFSKLLGLTVLLMNFSIVAGGFLALFNLLPYQMILVMFLLKFNMDFTLIYKSAKFFNRQQVLRSYFWSSIAYPVFSNYVAVLSLFRGFEWKGRKFQQ